MAIPDAAELALFNAAIRACQARIAVNLDYPTWTADVTDTFGGSALDTAAWFSTIPEPEVSGGALRLKASGVPPSEVVVSRPLWFPVDPSLPFEVEINATFPLLNCEMGYTLVMALGALDGGRSKSVDPMIIVQKGENLSGSGSVGDILVKTSIGFTHIIVNSSAATSDLTQAGQPGNTETVTIGSKVYTFQTVLTDVDGNVLIGASAIESLTNLRDAINLDPDTLGTGYAASMTLHPDVSASGDGDTTITVTAKCEGAAEDSIVTTTTAGNLSWDGATLGSGTGGVDPTTHEYIYRYEPDATLPFVAGAAKNSILVDTVLELETTDPIEEASFIQYSNTVRPFFIVIGIVSEFEDVVTNPAGTAASPVDAIVVEDVTVRELGGGGHETRIFPGWTTTDLGNDIDTAAEGERFTQDSQTWAKLAEAQVKSVQVMKGRDRDADSFTIVLAGADAATAGVTANIFKGDHMPNRPITIDIREEIEDGSLTSWRRQIAGVIDNVSTRIGEDGSPEIVVTGRDRPMRLMDTSISRSYLNTVGGGIDAVNIGFTVPDILGDVLDLADILSDDGLGAIDRNINASPDMSPEALTVGTGNLLASFTALADQLGLEVYRTYAVSGDSRYGKVHTGLWTRGLGAKRLQADGEAWQFVGPLTEPEHDGYWQTGGATGFFDTAAFMRLGENPGGTFHHAYNLFQLVEVPRRANIVSAVASWRMQGAGGGVVIESDVHFEIVAPPPAIPTSQADINGRARSTGVAWDFTNNLADDARLTTVDIAAALQEVIDRDDWVPGTSVMLLVITDTATDTFDFDTDNGDGVSQLIVEFDDGAEAIFHGVGSASELPAITNLRFPEGVREGVGQVVVHADNMLQSFEVFGSGEPGPADYPRAPYPPRSPELHTSLAESGIFDTLPVFRTIGARELPGGTGGLNEFGQGGRRGSVGQFRWWRENANRRRTEIVVHGQDWLEPVDEIGIDDPDVTGFDATEETWIVTDLRLDIRDRTLLTTIGLVTAEPIDAIFRGL